MTVRNIHTREGYDIWDKLCAIPCYGFLLAPEGSRAVKAEGIGNWIDKHAAQEVVDQAQSELNELRAALAAVTAERDRLARDLAFTEQWYAVRFERLAELGKSAGCWDAMAAIIANGTADSHEPPTYARQLVRANHRADVAERERDRLRAEVEALRNRSDLSCDRAYRNGMQRGYAFGSEGDDVGYQRSMALYCDGIHAAITAKDGQP